MAVGPSSRYRHGIPPSYSEPGARLETGKPYSLQPRASGPAYGSVLFGLCNPPLRFRGSSLLSSPSPGVLVAWSAPSSPLRATAMMVILRNPHHGLGPKVPAMYLTQAPKLILSTPLNPPGSVPSTAAGPPWPLESRRENTPRQRQSECPQRPIASL
ncbi:hypothetical protein FQN55_009461 [Onygenales sp. PD_40]|nr:hypothetical protein FQN55_009461 [Onygenales sp. PD_40]